MRGGEQLFLAIRRTGLSCCAFFYFPAGSLIAVDIPAGQAGWGVFPSREWRRSGIARTAHSLAIDAGVGKKQNI